MQLTWRCYVILYCLLYVYYILHPRIDTVDMELLRHLVLSVVCVLYFTRAKLQITVSSLSFTVCRVCVLYYETVYI